MKRLTKQVNIVVLVMLVVLVDGFAQESDKISGVVFGDSYYVLSHHDKSIAGSNGFWLRRIYFTYDHQFDDHLKSRLRLEMNDPGDFKTKQKMVPSVKDAYLVWQSNGITWTAGISSTPTWDNIEKIWGFRSVEKTPLDLQKMGHSRDFGLKVKGSFGKMEKGSWQLMIANGEGNSSENNKGGKVMGLLGLPITKQFYGEAYADYESTGSVVTWQAFAAYRTTKTVLAVQYAQQTNNTGLRLDVISGFGHWQLGKNKSFFLRIDRTLDPNPNGAKIAYTPMSKDAESNLILTGIAWQVHPQVTVIPNIGVVFYTNAQGTKPDNDLYGRLTLFFKW